MSDFDTVLERLVSDPHFQAALAADPNRALAGYRLEPSERELLGAQLVSGSGADRTVELRTSKSGVVGMLGPVAAALGLAAGTGTGSGTGSGGGASDVLGSAPTGDVLGDAPPLPDSAGGSGGSGGDVLGSAPDPGSGGGWGSAPVEAADYHTRVDVDGDGTWDANTAYERGDGGVDIVVDLDHDGRIDFVGHDYNRDGLVDVAEFDNDHDGVLETRMYDDNGDGWMDRSEQIPPPAPPAQAAPIPAGGSGDTWGDAPTT